MADEKKTPEENQEQAPKGMPDFSNFDPSKMPPFDPSKMPAGFPGFGGAEEDDGEEMENYLEQEDPRKWLRQPPHKIRGDMRKAMKAGRAADGMDCNCWNQRCPFHNDCKKCIVFHKVLKQLPTCLRDMVIELYVDGILPYELYITSEEKKPEL
jgi:hypothetical protein